MRSNNAGAPGLTCSGATLESGRSTGEFSPVSLLSAICVVNLDEPAAESRLRCSEGHVEHERR